jgi:Flp pilus assembly protein TadD
MENLRTTMSSFLPNDLSLRVQRWSRLTILIGLVLLSTAPLYATQKRYPEARTALEKARTAAPQDPEILNNLAYLLAEMRADLPTAAGYAQTAMRLNPQTKRYRHTLGWIHAQSKQYDQALPLLQETVREEPGNALYRFHLAVVLLEKGDRARAKKYLTEALGLKPDKDDEGRIKELLSKVG